MRLKIRTELADIMTDAQRELASQGGGYQWPRPYSRGEIGQINKALATFGSREVYEGVSIELNLRDLVLCQDEFKKRLVYKMEAMATVVVALPGHKITTLRAFFTTEAPAALPWTIIGLLGRAFFHDALVKANLLAQREEGKVYGRQVLTVPPEPEQRELDRYRAVVRHLFKADEGSNKRDPRPFLAPFLDIIDEMDRAEASD